MMLSDPETRKTRNTPTYICMLKYILDTYIASIAYMEYNME